MDAVSGTDACQSSSRHTGRVPAGQIDAKSSVNVAGSYLAAVVGVAPVCETHAVRSSSMNSSASSWGVRPACPQASGNKLDDAEHIAGVPPLHWWLGQSVSSRQPRHCPDTQSSPE